MVVVSLLALGMCVLRVLEFHALNVRWDQQRVRLGGLGELVTHATLLLLETRGDAGVHRAALQSEAWSSGTSRRRRDNALYWYFMTGTGFRWRRSSSFPPTCCSGVPMTDTRTTVAEGGRIAALWMGLLLAPTAFLVNLELSYLAVTRELRARDGALLHLIHGACLLVAIAGAVIAWRSWSAGGRRMARRGGRAGSAQPIPGGAGIRRERALRAHDRRPMDPNFDSPSVPVTRAATSLPRVPPRGEQRDATGSDPHPVIAGCILAPQSKG